MIRRPPRSTLSSSSAASDVYKRQEVDAEGNPYVASVYGTQSLDTSDLSNFTDFDSVTSSQVQGWVEGAMGAEAVQGLKDGLDANIADQKNPTSVTKTLVA